MHVYLCFVDFVFTPLYKQLKHVKNVVKLVSEILVDNFLSLKSYMYSICTNITGAPIISSYIFFTKICMYMVKYIDNFIPISK